MRKGDVHISKGRSMFLLVLTQPALSGMNALIESALFSADMVAGQTALL
jgi:hypothetical protein